MDVPLILLAAGRSTRFRTLKQVAPVGPGGASILAYTVADALLAGFSRVVVVVRPEIEAVIREHLAQHLGPGLPLRFAHQPVPHGTGHATLVGLAETDGPAAVANGDDAYGRAALTTLRQAADSSGGARGPDQPAIVALVAYPIVDTLSAHGGVSRGWVQTDGDRVTSVDEVYDVRLVEGGRLVGRSASGEARGLPTDALGSMNLWMLGPGVRPLLQRAFEQHRREDADGEFALSTVLDGLREAGDVEIRLAGAAGGWFGLTFAADLAAAQRRMAAAHRDRLFSDPLAATVDPFRRLPR